MAAGEDTVVCGKQDNLWIFLPRREAEYWEAVTAAIASGSWDRVRGAVGQETWECWWEDSNWRPEPGGTFDDPDDIPGYADGDYPPMPGALMMDWLPDDLIENFGEGVTTTYNGDRLDIYEEEEAQGLIVALRERGYVVEREDSLIGSLGRL